MLQETTYSQFDEPFARIHNESWGPDYNQTGLPTLEKLQLHIPDGANVLDFCCGPGLVLQWLTNKGYQVTGVDRSERMLQYAREKAPDCKLILGDVRFFESPPNFHAVFSTGLGFTHTLTLEDLTSIFRNAYKALQNNGIFVFDLRLHDGYNGGWNGSMEGDLQDDYAWVKKKQYYPETQEGRVYITIFNLVEGDYWKRIDTVWPVRGYTKDEVNSALEKVGFAEVSVYDFQLDLAASSSGWEDTVYFVCRKST
jgi:SAM-dependent methyltransferase